MAMLTVRNLPDEVHRALRVRAAQHGLSTEAEVRDILAVAVKPEYRVRLGDALATLGRKIGLTNEDVDALQQEMYLPSVEPLSPEEMKRIGSAKGKFKVPDSIDAHNDEVARLFFLGGNQS